ncbi:pyrimidine 5'-nucleotidase [Phaeobacter gallaeciensis]|uniref:Pyrimidine 5'-nucleotidase n=1 Tax=Phaeobacter gallaeciensis TaxID=60890 RepID=A0AAC9ZAY1_9RHOB|nr:pyrimidine 5'-nucleotidase [Phaeobacter gallaeciensis]AHD10572.1 pyrimidine 5'-nucleotidase [Phaeobacter gallaeciensis DSM 26640]ATE93835.1 putative pyrimidine 5'-nucleotidase [Phaeobacter gallaeciensis]ATE96344.1 putative pyrimidine 5'-nucleotidase [Phaeobacter gallaeciensis]ATF02499.1 putative pyrimidine 5'-nucleotidase [Phaeobacter gallaeciensis]ATF06879.1 putative pyrimidine 5'-nucleotidase [Phaeobacter gallaeciensis]
MVSQSFSHVRHWVFDLDNTLYHPSARLFDQIEVKMTDYVMTALGVDQQMANKLRDDYWREHGTTLAGLMAHHDLDPDPFLLEVHDINFDQLEPDTLLAERIRSLPGKRIIYTNGTAPYAEQVLAARGLEGCFDEIYGVEHANYRPKPERQAFDIIFAKADIDTARAAMFEDDPRNLQAPHDLGMRTVHVAPEATPGAHIHHHTDDLTGFLGLL